MELTRDQITKIVDLVLQQLVDINGAAPPYAARRVAAVFCGDRTGAEEGRRTVRSLMERGCSVTALFTPDAERVNGAAWLKEKAPGVQTPADPYRIGLKELVDSADLVIAPVMTYGGVGKLAHGIADNPALSMLMYALLQGRTVLAARDACAAEQDTPMAGLVIQRNIQLLETCGIRFVSASSLLTECMALLGTGTPEVRTPAQAREQFRGGVLTVSHLRPYQGGILSIPPSTIITPAARDEARKRNIELRQDRR